MKFSNIIYIHVHLSGLSVMCHYKAVEAVVFNSATIHRLHWRLYKLCCLQWSRCIVAELLNKLSTAYWGFRGFCNMFPFPKDAEELKKCNIFKQRQINVVPPTHWTCSRNVSIFQVWAANRPSRQSVGIMISVSLWMETLLQTGRVWGWGMGTGCRSPPHFGRVWGLEYFV